MTDNKAPELSKEGTALVSAQKTLRIGDKAPDFDVETTHGQINFYKFTSDKWTVLFSHPADFTPVCTTELGRVSKLKEEWEKRNVKVIALSVDNVTNHSNWVKDINEINCTEVWYPIIADVDRKVSIAYGMLDQNYVVSGLPATVRSVFVIDPNHVIKATITYPASTGRNFDEILRLVDSLQLAISHKVATPADWKKGADTVVLPTIPTDEAVKIFPKGVKEVRKWLRFTPDPATQ